MLTTFGTIAMITAIVIAIILYLSTSFYCFKKGILSKIILKLQILYIILIFTVFIYLFPSKIMLYPIKIAIFIFILSLSNIIVLIKESLKKRNMKKYRNLIIVIIVLFVLSVGTLSYGLCTETISFEPVREISQYEILELAGSHVYYWDSDNLEKKYIIISEEEVDIKITNTEEKSYIQVITTKQKKINRYDKEKNEIYVEGEKYILELSI